MDSYLERTRDNDYEPDKAKKKRTSGYWAEKAKHDEFNRSINWD